MLGFTAVCAIFFAIFGAAARGSEWAVGVSIGVLALAVMFSIHACLFALTWAFSGVASVVGRKARPSGGSPFRDDLPGRQPAQPSGSPFAAPSSESEQAATPDILDD